MTPTKTPTSSLSSSHTTHFSSLHLHNRDYHHSDRAICWTGFVSNSGQNLDCVFWCFLQHPTTTRPSPATGLPQELVNMIITISCMARTTYSRHAP